MKQVLARPEARPTGLLRAEIQAHAFCRMTRQDVAHERRRPGPMPDGWSPIPGSLLRQADDQTIVSLAAVRGALGRLEDREPARFDRWGILAASRFLGRSGLVQAIAGFQADGVWSVSPHLIPHLTLHSPAGTLSLALGIHGPNLGIGGGPNAGFEGFLTALTWLNAGVVPGLWMVLSRWSPEFLPDHRGEPRASCECQAMAMVVVPCRSTESGLPGLTLVESGTPGRMPPADLADLDAILSGRSPASAVNGHSIAPGVAAHAGHTASAIRRPHFASRAGSKARPRVIAADVSGTLSIELLRD